MVFSFKTDHATFAVLLASVEINSFSKRDIKIDVFSAFELDGADGLVCCFFWCCHPRAH